MKFSKSFLKHEPNLNLSSVSSKTVTTQISPKRITDRVLQTVLTEYYKISPNGKNLNGKIANK